MVQRLIPLGTPHTPGLNVLRRSEMRRKGKKFLPGPIYDLIFRKKDGDPPPDRFKGHGDFGDSSAGSLVDFDPEVHREYNARVYFKQEPGFRDPVNGPVITAWKMGDPPRSSNAQMAYDDFLRGLEIIGQAELFEHHGAGQMPPGMPGPVRREIFDELTEGTLKHADADLLALGEYERILQLRRDAQLRMEWFYSLYARVHYLSIGQKKTPGPKSRPTIRPYTAKLLVRRPEVDFDFFKFVLFCFAMGSLAYALYAQITSIVALCATPYVCPQGINLWKYRPVYAPPLTSNQHNGGFARHEGREGFVQRNPHTYGFTTKASCAYGTPGCHTPGYMTQWPYIQNKADLGSASVPEGIQAQCTRKENERVYDPDQGVLLNEFWDCKESSTPFMSGSTPYHFKKKWYERAKSVTGWCLREYFPDADWKRLKPNDLAELEICFFNHQDWGSEVDARECSCGANRVLYSLAAPGEADNLHYFDKFGCFFDSPVATSHLHVKYSACIAAPPATWETQPAKKRLTGISSENGILAHGKKMRDRALEATLEQGVGDAVPSRKTVALVFFLCKETGVLGLGVVILMAILAMLLFPIVGVVTNIIACVWFDEKQRTHVYSHAWHLLGDLVFVVTEFLWNFCLHLSSSYRIASVSYTIFTSSQLNNAYVKDGLTVNTNIGNLMMNLIVIVVGETAFEDAVVVWASIIFSAIQVVIAIVLEKIRQKYVASFLQDFNENRLSKFEIAVGLVKTMEDFIEDDVRFNWVQHFTGSERVRPDVLDDYEADPRRFESELEIDPDREKSFHDAKCCGTSLRSAMFGGEITEDNRTIFHFYPLLPRRLVKQFGHDGKFEWRGSSNRATRAKFNILEEKQKPMLPFPQVMSDVVLPSMPSAMPFQAYLAFPV